LTTLIDGGATMSGKRLNKTYLMQLLENRHPGYTIEALLVKAFREYGSEKEAAKALGITQQTFSTWKYRLRLEKTISSPAPSNTFKH
jgi:hypothetical protein